MPESGRPKFVANVGGTTWIKGLANTRPEWGSNPTTSKEELSLQFLSLLSSLQDAVATKILALS